MRGINKKPGRSIPGASSTLAEITQPALNEKKGHDHRVPGPREQPTPQRVMAVPFSNYRDSFSPETLAVLEAAFNAAWDAVVASGMDCDQQATRTALADAIVYFAS